MRGVDLGWQHRNERAHRWVAGLRWPEGRAGDEVALCWPPNTVLTDLWPLLDRPKISEFAALPAQTVFRYSILLGRTRW